MGSIVHFELPTEDPTKSLEFYKKVLDWKFNQFGDKSYWLADTGNNSDNGINGAVTIKESLFKNPVIVMQVDDIKATVIKVEEYGGVVVSPINEIPNVGLVAYFKDPDQNVIGLIQDQPK